MKQNDGGPAYPTLGRELTDMTGAVVTSGMTLRDWFAGQALAALLSYSGRHESEPMDAERWAWAAYAQADAMLAERAKP